MPSLRASSDTPSTGSAKLNASSTLSVLATVESCSGTYPRIVTTPLSPSTRRRMPGLDRLRRERRAGDRRQPVLATDDGSVAHHPAGVGDGRRDAPEDRRPRRSGDRSDQDLAVFDLRHLFGAGQHPGDPLDDAGRRREAVQAAVGAHTTEPLLDRLAGDAPQHDRERLGHDVGRRARVPAGRPTPGRPP